VDFLKGDLSVAVLVEFRKRLAGCFEEITLSRSVSNTAMIGGTGGGRRSPGGLGGWAEALTLAAKAMIHCME
jgi:hypothetical protein